MVKPSITHRIARGSIVRERLRLRYQPCQKVSGGRKVSIPSGRLWFVWCTANPVFHFHPSLPPPYASSHARAPCNIRAIPRALQVLCQRYNHAATPRLIYTSYHPKRFLGFCISPLHPGTRLAASPTHCTRIRHVTKIILMISTPRLFLRHLAKIFPNDFAGQFLAWRVHYSLTRGDYEYYSRLSWYLWS